VGGGAGHPQLASKLEWRHRLDFALKRARLHRCFLLCKLAPPRRGSLLAAAASLGTLHRMTQMADAERKMLRDLVRTMVAENDYSEILLACMRDLLEHDNADRALDLARAMAEVIRQQQEFVRLVQKLLEGTPVERAEMQAALEKERARRNRAALK